MIVKLNFHLLQFNMFYRTHTVLTVEWHVQFTNRRVTLRKISSFFHIITYSSIISESGGGGHQKCRAPPPLHKSSLSFKLLLNKNIPDINRSLLRTELGVETFLTKNRIRGMEPIFDYKNAKNGTEWDDCSSTQNGTEWDGREQERNN